MNDVTPAFGFQIGTDRSVKALEGAAAPSGAEGYVWRHVQGTPEQLLSGLAELELDEAVKTAPTVDKEQALCPRVRRLLKTCWLEC